MVFKSYHRHICQTALQHDIIDQTPLALLGIHIDQVKPFYHTLVRFIIFSKELVSAAHSNHHSVIFYIIFKIFLDFQQIFTYDRLFPVGAASQKHDVQF